ncbi:unnamed protein product [Phyllotreta striolata]|uniref:Cyclic nucleotide-binding domain-containing protein n=1 Tax=Phyllotreta striolata TaxID=444603 RepID=A0A9P0DUV4_PHYSR|nr:unnamed protein product [Phyllotreta striolata]
MRRYLEHKCSLRIDDQRAEILPTHPAGKWKETWIRRLKLSLAMNEDHPIVKRYYKTNATMRNEMKLHTRGRHWFVIHPFSKFNFGVQIVYTILFLERWLLLVEYFNVPFWLKVLEIIRDLIWVVMMLSFFFTGYTEYKTREVVMHPKKTARHYLFTYFAIDLFMVIEDIIGKMLLDLNKSDIEVFVMALQVVIVLYTICFVIRLRTVLNFIENFALFAKLNNFYIFLFNRLIVLIFMLHLFAILFFLIPRCYYVTMNERIIPPTSWISLRKLTKNLNTDAYVESLLIVISYFLGSHYQDNFTEVCEQILLIIFSLIGKVYVITFIAHMLVKFIVVNKSEGEYENMHLQLINYMKTMKVPGKLQKQILDRFVFKHQKKYFDDDQLMATLSEPLKLELFIYSSRRLMRNNGLLKKLSPYQKGFLMAHMKSETYSKGESICEFDSSPYLYFIASGSILALGRDDLLLYRLTDGDEFGMPSKYKGCEKEVVKFLVRETSEIFSVEKSVILEMIGEEAVLKKHFLQLVEERQKLVNNAFKNLRLGGESLLHNLRMGTILEYRLRKELVLD